MTEQATNCVAVLRQPVIERKVVEPKEGETGGPKLSQSAKSYVRTKEPLEEREEYVLQLEWPRVTVSWGGITPLVSKEQFSLRTGRCIGNPDWILSKPTLKRLRQQVRMQITVVEGDAEPDEEEKPKAERWPMLASRLSQISEDYWAASWLIDLEHDLWNMILNGPEQWGGGVPPASELQELKLLSDACGGWVRWGLGGSPEFVAMDDWLSLHAEWMIKQQAEAATAP